MRKLLSIFTIMVAVLLVSSCQKELPDAVKNIDVSQGDKTPSPTPTPTPDSTPSPELKLNKNDLSFTEAGGSETFSITSNTSWSIASDQDWCMVSSSSGSNNATVTVNVSENTSTDQRSATITVRAGNIQQSIAVTQAAAKVQDTRQKLNLRFIESGILMNSDETVTIPFTHDGDLSKLDDSQFKCTVDDAYTGGVYLAEGYVHVDVGEALATVDVELSFEGNEYYLPESIGIMVTYIPPVNDNVRSFTVNGVSFKMIRVDGGTFMMGATSEQGSDAADDEKPAHQVTLLSYYIGETEVTQELWQAVMGSNPSHFRGSQKPVECVSWDDCQEFIRKLNSLTGQSFCLPSEAAWEFAARGGNKSRGYKYAGSNTIDDVAWYYENSFAKGSSSSDYGTHNVATKQANELGLYDMSGNVEEWCNDWYISDPSLMFQLVVRGGSWASYARGCRVSSRDYNSADGIDGEIGLGLRLAL